MFCLELLERRYSFSAQGQETGFLALSGLRIGKNFVKKPGCLPLTVLPRQRLPQTLTQDIEIRVPPRCDRAAY
ncbi:hypothetical protein J0895_06660 [Phormidium pseudopriestleyi FRX01]|uniref:Uncharacterized protein n=1 Tax=Phormidium pseudopriestleyi FRX01 TaxID=1759528 RepID=A0ABS3FNV6_9CYAN|nr:hypothetical protein [Phormidium pseudopriestleyi]MBO0348787.1 hypothetical protein [Phormidium pseudopriestleyi FRX01]